jgi:hypothetical protein
MKKTLAYITVLITTTIKGFIVQANGTNPIKLFYGRNLQIFVVS